MCVWFVSDPCLCPHSPAWVYAQGNSLGALEGESGAAAILLTKALVHSGLVGAAGFSGRCWCVCNVGNDFLKRKRGRFYMRSVGSGRLPWEPRVVGSWGVTSCFYISGIWMVTSIVP